MSADARRHSPAAERNRAPILAAWRQILPATGVSIEIASGTGQHAAHFATALPDWRWHPTDGDPQTLSSITAWCDGLTNVAAPVHLDLLAKDGSSWPGLPASVDAVYCANLLHISPWATCAALMAGAARHLRDDGVLVLYGPYRVGGEPLAAGNAAFDADLRERDPRWGLRCLEDVVDAAGRAGLRLAGRRDMPANNLLLVLRR